MAKSFKFIGALALFVAAMYPAQAEQPILQCDYLPELVEPTVETSDWQRDHKKYISPYQLQHKMSKGLHRLLLADVRNADAFKRGHIGRSFNFPHSKLASMPFYRDKSVVLIGQGRSYRHLEALHQRLTEHGFKDVSILDGGVDYWKTVIESKASFLKVEEHHLINNAVGGDSDFWQIVDSSGNPNLDQFFDHVIALKDLAMLQTPESFNKQINQPNQLIRNVLLILPENMDSMQVLKVWRARLKANVYAMSPQKVQSALQVQEHNRRIVQYKKRRSDGAKMSCS